jgi:NAD(P)-dependent dehydrogenase (short-subunit alcohol dehydrogenase family)
MSETERRELSPGDVVAVTGGAGGIGRAISLQAAGRGARVAVLDVADGAPTVEAVTAAGGEARYFPCDVTSEDSLAAARDAIAKAWGTPFGLVSNAGVFPRFTLMETPLAEWNRALSVNLTGCFLCARTFAPAMVKAGRGAIVNISSGHGVQGAKKAGAYCASKAGIISLTKTLALELAPAVRVNSVLPGVTETEMPLAATNIDELRGRGAVIPLGRIGRPEDIARIVCFLLGEDASYLTGQGISAGGGRVMIP